MPVPLPAGLPVSVLAFGPYPDAAGTGALSGLTGRITPVDPHTRRPVRLVHVATGAVVIPQPVTVTIGEDTTATAGPLPRQGTGQLSPDNFVYAVEWEAAWRAPSPGNRHVALPADSPDVVDFDLLEVAAIEPAVHVPVAVGPGVAPGGLTGQVLVKATAADFDTTWASVTTEDGGTGGVTLSQVEDVVAGHVEAPTPHPAYDDLPSLRLLFENGLI